MGLEAVVEMDGGFAEWKKRGYPVAEKPTKKA
jgi:3-mercaptopyruvate sulfurtransferase SseA